MSILERARDFILREARLIDRRLFEVGFEGGDPRSVLAAIRAYQNPDGGFGHALEADTRTAASQPLYVEVALEYMADAGLADAEMASRACDFLQAVSGPDGGAPILLPGFEAAAHAAHWRDLDFTPGINPNGGVVGRLYELGIEHPWRERAAAFCWAQMDGVDGAHDASEALIFLEHAPDQARAGPAMAKLLQGLPDQRFYKADPAAEGYGLTPLNYAPSPESAARALFDDDLIARNLDHLAAEQQADGGWPIAWEPPSAAAVSEWRGVVTLRALKVLKAYGRI
ncbi:MAG TPA: hypothetical protein VEA79_01045 [Phenylobacterium sp.]|nr:hypothetical protein [Phenylobacterium sp.]